MLSTSSIVLNSYVNFNCYAPAILGTGYQGAEVLAILDYDSANRITPNLAVLWASVYPSIQAQGYVNDYTKYPYLKLRTSNGTMVAVAFPWIQDTSFLVQQAASLTLVIDSVNPADQANITAALASIGITNFTITSAAPVTSPTPSPTPTPSGGSATTAAADFNFTINGLQVAFTDTSIDPHSISAWAWNFGDSSGTATVKNPTYTYAGSGTYVVTLTVTDSTNTSYQTEGTVTVTAPAPTPTPTPTPSP